MRNVYNKSNWSTLDPPGPPTHVRDFDLPAPNLLRSPEARELSAAKALDDTTVHAPLSESNRYWAPTWDASHRNLAFIRRRVHRRRDISDRSNISHREDPSQSHVTQTLSDKDGELVHRKRCSTWNRNPITVHRSRNSAAGLDSWSLWKFAVSGDCRGAPSTPRLGDRSPVKNGKGDEVMRVGTQKGDKREKE